MASRQALWDAPSMHYVPPLAVHDSLWPSHHLDRSLAKRRGGDIQAKRLLVLSHDGDGRFGGCISLPDPTTEECYRRGRQRGPDHSHVLPLQLHYKLGTGRFLPGRLDHPHIHHGVACHPFPPAH